MTGMTGSSSSELESELLELESELLGAGVGAAPRTGEEELAAVETSDMLSSSFLAYFAWAST